MAVTTAQVQQAYVAFFNRPADLAGLNYWTSSPAASVANLLDAFSKTPEYTSLYSNMNSTQLVNAVYQNLFGRAVESVDALNYWVGLLDKGTVTLGSIAATVADLAITNKTADGTLVSNKVAAATAFTTSLSTASNADSATAYATANSTGLQAVKNWLAAVTSDAATLTNATSATTLNSLLSTVKSNVTSTGSTGSTFTLTTGTDVLTPDQADSTKKTTGGDDVFRGDLAAGDLASADTIDGGAGNDTLNALLNATAAAPVLKNIEKIVVSTVTGPATLNLTDATGVNEVWHKGTAGTGQGLTVTNISTSTAVGVQGTQKAAETSTFTFKNVGGSTDTATLNLKEVVVGAAADAVSVLGIETLKVVVSDDAATTTAAANANTINSLVLTNTKTITLTGAAGTGGVTTLGGNAANDFKALTKFDASGFTGDLTVDFDTGTESDAGITILASSKGSNNIKMSTGTQADVVKFTSANVSTINKITSLAQFDSVGEDKIDLSAFALGADTTIGTSAVKPAGDIAGFFTGTARIVTHDDGTDSFVYVDANKDGNFNAGSDLAIKLVGVTGTGGAAANIDSYTLADFILA